MKRVLGIVLLGLGIALAVFAAGLRFYVTPIATNIPYDLDRSTTVAEAQDGAYLSVTGSGARIETGALRSETFVVPRADLTRSELSGDLAGEAVIWDVYDQITDISSGDVVTASSQEFALDRSTGEYAAWDGAWADGGDGEEDFTATGYSYKLPFNTEQTTYAYWDDTLGETVDLTYVATETVSGLEAYKFTSTVELDEIDYDATTVGVLNSLYGPGDVEYGVTRTIWVEPVTGQFLNVVQDVTLQYSRASGTPVPLLKGVFEYTQASKDNAAESISTNRNLLLLVSTYLPIGGGAGGLILVILGIVLIATAKPKDEAGAEAPTTAAVGS